MVLSFLGIFISLALWAQDHSAHHGHETHHQAPATNAFVADIEQIAKELGLDYEIWAGLARLGIEKDTWLALSSQKKDAAISEFLLNRDRAIKKAKEMLARNSYENCEDIQFLRIYLGDEKIAPILAHHKKTWAHLEHQTPEGNSSEENAKKTGIEKLREDIKKCRLEWDALGVSKTAQALSISPDSHHTGHSQHGGSSHHPDMTTHNQHHDQETNHGSHHEASAPDDNAEAPTHSPASHQTHSSHHEASAPDDSNQTASAAEPQSHHNHQHHQQQSDNTQVNSSGQSVSEPGNHHQHAHHLSSAANSSIPISSPNTHYAHGNPNSSANHHALANNQSPTNHSSHAPSQHETHFSFDDDSPTAMESSHAGHSTLDSNDQEIVSRHEGHANHQAPAMIHNHSEGEPLLDASAHHNHEQRSGHNASEHHEHHHAKNSQTQDDAELSSADSRGSNNLNPEVTQISFNGAPEIATTTTKTPADRKRLPLIPSIALLASSSLLFLKLKRRTK